MGEVVEDRQRPTDSARLTTKTAKLVPPGMSEPHGPIKISTNRQIALPKALLDRLRLEPGDSVYVLQSDAEPEALMVVPVERLTEWVRLGKERSGRSARDRTGEVERNG
jgi:bifunctional DNA-binding transcriptional regulator/antitoxin component of YhaV-PrlF toxin-antitoxin module